MNYNNLNDIRTTLGLRLLDLYKTANAGHVGASLSCLEILIYLYYQKARQQDTVILSKGHAAGALYVVLDSKQMLQVSLDTFYQEGTWLAGHPPCNGQIPAIPFGTGSLGHGLGLACGIALGAELKNEDRKVYCILSEGDCNEGSTWEALHFAAHRKLKNLYIILDFNGLQGIGKSSEILNLEPISERLDLMGLQVQTASNGNSFDDLAYAMQDLESKSITTKVLIARTTKGNSVSYMENQIEWHYLPMNDLQYKKAVQEQKK